MYFYFDGEKATLSLKKEEGKEIGEVNDKVLGKIKLMYKTNNPVLFCKKKKELDNIFPLLKSNLQKQIRRGEKEAIATASLMMDMNDFEFLRRLSVIAAEDVELSIQTTVIVWLMTATSKGFLLSPPHKDFILSYVASLLAHPICYRLEINSKKGENLNLKDVLNLDHPDKELIAAILFRNSFGGLKGDSLMISSLCSEMINSKRRLISLSPLKYEITKLKITDSAIDFHIYFKLLSLIEKDTGIDADIIKRTVWECSSRINYRFHEKSDLIQIWEKIQNSFSYHTKSYLLYLFRN